VITAIANEMAAGNERRGIPPGDLATLRRGMGGAAFWRVAVRHLEPAGFLSAPGHVELRAEDERRWIAILQGMATMVSLHRPRRRLGEVMAGRYAAERPLVAEARVQRLLAAEGRALAAVLRGVVQQLASAGQPVDWTYLADLVLCDGSSAGGERVRNSIGFEYYRVLEGGGARTVGEEEE
jgi:CRISPR type I-E-associated protein CasB/Cse2